MSGDREASDLIFANHDGVPRPDFVETPASLSAPGHFRSGGLDREPGLHGTRVRQRASIRAWCGIERLDDAVATWMNHCVEGAS